MSDHNGDRTEAFIFDLDQTLVDSSEIEIWRSLHDWKTALKSIDQIKPFPFKTAPHLIPSLLADEGIKVGIATSSIREYAEAVIKKFQIRCDVLITGSDKLPNKPAPDTLLKAAKALRTSHMKTAYVGDKANDIIAAARADMLSVGVSWGGNNWLSQAPDILINQPELLLELKDKHRYAGEVINPINHDGSYLWAPDNNAVFLGRHFSESDFRSPSGRMSKDITQFKQTGEHAKYFARRVAGALFELRNRTNWWPAYAVHIPMKPGQTNRFEPLFEILENKPEMADIKWLTDGLNLLKVIPNYKQMKAAERREAIRGAFGSKYTWKNADILLVDDVHTTGETTDEATRALVKDGARSVKTLALAKHQRKLEVEASCPKCGVGKVALRTNKRDGSKFWACTMWSKSGGCKWTMPFGSETF